MTEFYEQAKKACKGGSSRLSNTCPRSISFYPTLFHMTWAET